MSFDGHIANCKCPNCSQGYCHFCEPRETCVVIAIREHEAYRYLAGCGKVTLPYKSSDAYAFEASACPAHKTEHGKKGAK